jgi:hypothetical protein
VTPADRRLVWRLVCGDTAPHEAAMLAAADGATTARQAALDIVNRHRTRAHLAGMHLVRDALTDTLRTEGGMP